MSWLLIVVALAVLLGIGLVAAGRGDGLVPVDPDRSPMSVLPESGVGRADVDSLRFARAVRGYRMDEVDAVLDRLVDEIESRDRRIAELEARAPQPTPGTPQPRPEVEAEAERPWQA